MLLGIHQSFHAVCQALNPAVYGIRQTVNGISGKLALIRQFIGNISCRIGYGISGVRYGILHVFHVAGYGRKLILHLIQILFYFRIRFGHTDLIFFLIQFAFYILQAVLNIILVNIRKLSVTVGSTAVCSAAAAFRTAVTASRAAITASRAAITASRAAITASRISPVFSFCSGHSSAGNCPSIPDVFPGSCASALSYREIRHIYQIASVPSLPDYASGPDSNTVSCCINPSDTIHSGTVRLL